MKGIFPRYSKGKYQNFSVLKILFLVIRPISFNILLLLAF